MSTTVTYKGSTITTVDNETKVLATGGKYLEGNITLTDTSSGGNLGTKNITANGTYNASSDNLDGYSQVSVAVPAPTTAPITTIMPGEFSPAIYGVSAFSYVNVATYHTLLTICASTAEDHEDDPEWNPEEDEEWYELHLSIDSQLSPMYIDRYPVAIIITPSNGPMGNGITNTTPNLHGLVSYMAVKTYDDRDPDPYNSGDIENWYTVTTCVKNSSSVANSYTSNYKYDAKIIGSDAVHNSSAFYTVVKMLSATDFSVMVKRDGPTGSSYGLVPGVDYDMHIIYEDSNYGQSSVLYEAYNLSFDGTNYIDTGVYLFTQENYQKDFELIADITPTYRDTNATIICAKHNGNSSGFLVRTNGATITTYKGTISVDKLQPSTVIIKRINGTITLNGTNITNPTVQFKNEAFNWSLHLGCAIADGGSRYRYSNGTIDHILVRWL